MSLDVQSTTIKDYAYADGVVYIFSANGVDIYQPSYIEWERSGFASLANVTAGAVNDNGIWLGTSDTGVWHCPLGSGDLTSQLSQYYATSGTTYAIQSNNIACLAGIDGKLLIAHDAGAEYLPSIGNPYQYSDVSGCDACAINDTYIAYSVSSGLHTMVFPTANWTSSTATVLTTSSTPALSSNTVNCLKYGDENRLFIATGDGLDIYSYLIVNNTELFVSPSLDADWTDNLDETYTYAASPAATGFMTVASALTALSSYLVTMTGSSFSGTSFGFSNTSFDGGLGDRYLDADGTINAVLVANGTSLKVYCIGTALEASSISCKLVTQAETIVTIGSGNIAFVWPSSTGTQSVGYVSYVDSADDVIIYNISGSEIIETHAGTFSACWIDDQADLVLYDDELERHAFIDHISPTNNAIDVTRTWSIYFEIGDTLNGLSSNDISLKINDVAVTETIVAFGSGFSSGFSSGFGGEGFAVTYTPPSASGYRETVSVEVTATDGAGESFSESGSFITEAPSVTTAATTQPPNVIVYKDLSLSNAEDTYNSVEVNWVDERISAYYVDEDQAKASAQVIIEDGIYHRYNLTLRILDTDASSNDTQDIKIGDLITFDCASLGLTNQKCEVLSKQRLVVDDRIEYALSVSYYVVWS